MRDVEVYLEVTYCINALLILLTFEILCFLLNIQMRKRDLMKYVFTYNISFLFLYLDVFEGFLFVYSLILTLFYFKKQIYIYYPLYLFIYISLLSFLEWIVPYSTIYQGVLLVETFHISSFFIIGILSCLIIYFYISFCSYQLNKDELVDVSFLNIQCRGFIDNGNKVFYKGYPVVFISEHFIRDCPVIDTIEITTANKTEKMKMIVLDEMTINHQTLYHVYVGMMKAKEYDCIVNSQLMGGLL